MSQTEGSIQVASIPLEETNPALMTASTALLTTSSHDRSTPSSSPEGFRTDPPLTPEKTGEEGVFGSAIYRNLGERWSPVEEKMAAGYRLIDAQKKDIDRMSSRLVDIQNQLREKDGAVAQLYTMIEQVSPVLKQMSGWNAKLTAEEQELQNELKKVKRLLGIEEADTEHSDFGTLPSSSKEGSSSPPERPSVVSHALSDAAVVDDSHDED